ncbi:MAG: ribonuclease HII [Flavobacteriaceae bacterium]
MRFRVLIALIVLFVFGCTNDKKTSTPLLNYVPENTSILIKINDMASFTNGLMENDFLSKVKTSNIYTSVFEKIELLNFLNPESESILAFPELGKGDFEFIFIADEAPGLFDIDSLEIKVIESRPYEGQNIDTYQIDKAVFYTIETNQKIIISSSLILLENLVRNLGKPNVSSVLERLYTTANKARPASIFLNLDKSNGALLSFLKDSSKVSASDFSDWVSLDLNLGHDYIQMRGVSVANDSLKNYLNLFRNTNPLTNTTPSFAPVHADAILSYSFDNYNVFAKNQQKYLDQSTPRNSLFTTVEEIGFIYLNGQKIIVINSYGSETISEYLTGIKTGAFTYQGNEILELGTTDFLKNSLYPIIKEYKANYCAIIENAFVFSEQKEILQTIISNYKKGTTFDKSAAYMAIKESLASESTLLFISNSKGIENILKDNFTKELYTDFKKSKISKYAFGIQVVADKDFFHTNTIIQKIEKKTRTRNVSTLFSVQLENAVATNPQFIHNHRTNKKEIIVQDQANILYLISTEGKILWKKQLKSHIQGKIEQVDIYKNGRLQLAFTTDNQFLILDRNGKEVGPFTISYEGGNLNPLAVFDYDKKKNYRFVVSQGQKIFMYNSKGSIVDGYKYTRAEKAIVGVAKHYRIGRKDYLIFKLEDGSLKVLNRVGTVRTKVSEKIDFSENEIFLYKNKFTITDTKGTLHQIDQKGRITKINFNLNKDHGIDATSNSLVVMNDNILNIKGRKVELDLGVYTKPSIFYRYNKIYVSVTDIQNQKVYLFDSQAKPIPNFPVFGTSIVNLDDINNDRQLELVVKDQENSIRIYQIN